MTQHHNKTVIIYGGAFNPPTVAHVQIIHAIGQYAVETGAEFWILPSGDRPDKTIAVPRERRLEYIAAMIQDAGIPVGVEVKVIEDELDRTVLTETCDTVHELRERYPGVTFQFVFGADSTGTMAEWREGQWLLDDLDMLVIERAGSTVNPLARKAVLLPVVTTAVSSTEVRARLAAGQSVHGLVSPSVEALLTFVL